MRLDARSTALFLLAAGLVVATPRARAADGAPAEEPIETDTLQSGEPLVVEDALPWTDGFLLRTAVQGGDVQGRDGILLKPGVSYGFGVGLELAVDWSLGVLEGDGNLGAVAAGAQLQVLAQSTLLPSLAVAATGIAADDDESFATRLGVRATREGRAGRLHLNVDVQLQRAAAARIFGGVGADRPLADWLRVMADAAYERFPDDATGALTIEAGLSARVAADLLLQGTVGFNRFGADADPRALVGLMRRL